MGPLDHWDSPDHAIRAFEALTGFCVTVHDLTTSLWPYLPPERFKHCSNCCMAVKATHDWACMDFEVTRLRKDILKFPDGRYQQCHAGFIEWVIPVFIRNQLAWILFAGQARAEGTYEYLARDIRQTTPTQDFRNRLPEVSETKSAFVLESLRQLRSRLLELHTTLDRMKAPSLSKQKNVQSSRTHAIRTFIFNEHASDPSVSDLAKYLGLSDSRTIHLVKELLGCSYVDLLNQMRLRTATSLLRNTSLSVLAVCHASGFGDLSYFHRLFNKHFEISPLKYRKSVIT